MKRYILYKKMRKVHIITGASRGIGRQVAIKFSYDFPDSIFIIIGRDKPSLLETKSLMNNSKNVVIKQIDLANKRLIIETIRYIGEEYGRIDSLVNIAGFVNPKSLLETSIENWETTYNINITAVFLLTKEVVRFMKNRGGKILNVSSTAGFSSRPGWSAYASSKAALISLSNTLSDELQEYGIKVYVVSPGRCATDLRKKLAPEEDPKGIMQPVEVAKVISNLMSDTGNHLDGQNIVIRKQIKTV